MYLLAQKKRNGDLLDTFTFLGLISLVPGKKMSKININPLPAFLLQAECIWDVYEMKPKRVDSCDGPDVTTVYIGVDVEDCPCPWVASCDRVRVSGSGYTTDGNLDIYG